MVPLGPDQVRVHPAASDNGAVHRSPSRCRQAPRWTRPRACCGQSRRAARQDPGDRVLPEPAPGSGRRQRPRRSAAAAPDSGASRWCWYDRKQRQRTLAQVVRRGHRADDATSPAPRSASQTASGGGGAAQPVQVLVTGEDPQTLQALAARVQDDARAACPARATSPTASRRPTPRRGSCPTGSAWPTPA